MKIEKKQMQYFFINFVMCPLHCSAHGNFSAEVFASFSACNVYNITRDQSVVLRIYINIYKEKKKRERERERVETLYLVSSFLLGEKRPSLKEEK